MGLRLRQDYLAARLDVDLAREAAELGDAERAAVFAGRAWQLLTDMLPAIRELTGDAPGPPSRPRKAPPG